MRLEVSGVEKLAAELRKKNRVRYDSVSLKNLTQMFNRAKGNTPIDTRELVRSAGIQKPNGDFGGEMGYTKEYAPHVEYGHRTKGGGFVQGQHFLRDNVEIQRPIFRQDLINQLKKG